MLGALVIVAVASGLWMTRPSPNAAKLSSEGAKSDSPGQASAPPWVLEKKKPCPEWAASPNILNFVPFRSTPLRSPLHCPVPEFDYGAIGGSQPIDHVFKITNAGKKALAGLIVTTSCGCTSASLSQTSIAPGQSALVQVHMNMRAYRGLQKHRILVTTADRGIPALVLTMQGTILDE